jgi:hypothetical protein
MRGRIVWSALIALASGCAAVPSTQADAGSADGGVDEQCRSLAGPGVSGTCCHCSSGHTCEANQCYGGFSCDVSACRCVATPLVCASLGTGVPDPGAIQGSVDARTGGRVNRLYFAAVGDTRPAIINDTQHYPSDVIGGIYTSLGALSPLPEFAIATGDYVYASTTHAEAAAQLALYTDARRSFPSPLWAVLGNHECTGFTSSHCGSGNPDGFTANYNAYVNALLTPAGETSPWFERRVDAIDHSWTAKFLFLAPNAWSATQKSWFQNALAQPTTYTFIVQHEPAATGTSAPGVPDINDLLRGASVTLSIVGHTHTWRKTEGAAEVIVGNGGAPLEGTSHYGYTLFTQRDDGAIVVTAYDSTTNTSFASFVVNADGTTGH